MASSADINRIQKIVLPFGKHKGQPLDAVPLKCLDWLLGQEWLFADLRESIEVYLSHPPIAQELERQLEEDE